VAICKIDGGSKAVMRSAYCTRLHGRNRQAKFATEFFCLMGAA
jgi:hypothetical protein